MFSEQPSPAYVRSQHTVSHFHEHLGSARVRKFLDVVPPALCRPAQVGVDGDATEEGDLDQGMHVISDGH